jgi:hypothetical protein
VAQFNPDKTLKELAILVIVLAICRSDANFYLKIFFLIISNLAQIRLGKDLKQKDVEFYLSNTRYFVKNINRNLI